MMRRSKQNKRRGYTLIELSVVIVLVILIASTLTAMLRQQVQFFTWWDSQKFIAEEAPLINSVVVRVFSNADTFRLHAGANAAAAKANALANVGGVTAGATCMVLGFADATGTKSFGLIEFVNPNPAVPGSGQLWFNTLNAAGNAVALNAGAAVRWKIASGIQAANFSVVSDPALGANGMMNLTLTGPYGGQVTYAATPSL